MVALCFIASKEIFDNIAPNFKIFDNFTMGSTEKSDSSIVCKELKDKLAKLEVPKVRTLTQYFILTMLEKLKVYVF